MAAFTRLVNFDFLAVLPQQVAFTYSVMETENWSCIVQPGREYLATSSTLLTILFQNSRNGYTLSYCFFCIFQALHKESGQVLAIKQVPVDTDLQEIIKEISIMQQCDSPYVVKYYGSYFKNTDLWVSAQHHQSIATIDCETLQCLELGFVFNNVCWDATLKTLVGLPWPQLCR